jgi:hypothetical protein
VALVVALGHVRFDVARASNCAAARFEANPVFARIVALETRVIDVLFAEFGQDGYVVWSAVGAVAFWLHCEESIDLSLH